MKRILLLAAAVIAATGCNKRPNTEHVTCQFLPTGQHFHMGDQDSYRGEWWISMESADGKQMFMTNATADKWQCWDDRHGH